MADRHTTTPDLHPPMADRSPALLNRTFFSEKILHLRQGRFLLAYLKSIKALTIHTDYGALAHEGCRVNLVDKAEYLLRFTLSCQHEKHVTILATVASMTIHHRTATVGSGLDGRTQLQILIRNDKELNRTALGILHMIHCERHHKEADITINHHLPGT